jgi:hypothetical protein
VTEYPSKNAKPPTEAKVKAAATGAGLGAAVGGLLCWLVDAYAITPGVEGDLPPAVSTVVLAGAAAGVAWLSGYVAKHSPRRA